MICVTNVTENRFRSTYTASLSATEKELNANGPFLFSYIIQKIKEQRKMQNAKPTHIYFIYLSLSTMGQWSPESAKL